MLIMCKRSTNDDKPFLVSRSNQKGALLQLGRAPLNCQWPPFMRSVRCGALLVLAALLLTTVSAHAAADVVIAAEDDWPPYSFVGRSGGDATGFAVNLVREAFASQGVHVRFLTVPFARCMFLAKIGKVSGCFDATILNENRDQYYWHKTPMFHEELSIFGRDTDPRSNLTLHDLEGTGKRVGYTIEYTYPESFTLNSHLLKYGAKSDVMLLQMLAAGHLDYIVVNTTPAYMHIRHMGKSAVHLHKVGVISEDGFWVAFTRADPSGAELARTFDRGLQALHDNGRYRQLQEEMTGDPREGGPAR